MGIDPEKQHADGTFKRGVVQNIDTVYKPGTSGNPSGRPCRKEFTKLLHKVFPDETIMFMMFAKLHGIDTNFTITKDALKLIKDPNVKKELRKYLNKLEKGKGPSGNRFRTKLSDKDETLLLQWLVEQKIGKAQQFTTTEITTPEDKKITVEFVKSEDDDNS